MITIGFQPAKDEFYPCLKSRSVNGKGERLQRIAKVYQPVNEIWYVHLFPLKRGCHGELLWYFGITIPHWSTMIGHIYSSTETMPLPPDLVRRQLRKGPPAEILSGLRCASAHLKMEPMDVLGLLGLLGLLGGLAPASSKIFTIPHLPSSIATSMGYTGSILICDLVRGDPNPSIVQRNPIFQGCKPWNILNISAQNIKHVHKPPKYEWPFETSRAVHIIKSMSIQKGSQQLRTALQHGSSKVGILWHHFAPKELRKRGDPYASVRYTQHGKKG